MEAALTGAPVIYWKAGLIPFSPGSPLCQPAGEIDL